MTSLGALVVVPLACILTIAGSHTPVNIESVLFPAPSIGETTGELSLPAEERPVLLRAAANGPDSRNGPVP